MAEVIVTASKVPNAKRAAVGGFADAPLLQTPAAVTVISQQTMQDLQIRNTSDAVRLDASINDAYNAVGYAEQFSIRGFKLDNNSSYRKDGIAIPGDTQIPLENKERIEVLKGLAGLQAGMAAPGGVIDFIVKRPTSYDPAHGHRRSARARHRVRRAGPGRAPGRPALRLPHQPGGRAPALVCQGRRRQPQIHLGRVRLANFAASLAAD